MNVLRQIAVVCLLLGVVMAASAQTDTVSATSIQRKTDGRILQPDNTTAPATATAIQPRPDRTERTLAPEIKQQLKKFEVAREAFINRQEQMRKELQGATTDKERDAIRQRIKESLEQWREQARQFRDEAKERVKELQRELPSLREALQEGPGTGPKTGGRPGRPGID